MNRVTISVAGASNRKGEGRVKRLRGLPCRTNAAFDGLLTPATLYETRVPKLFAEMTKAIEMNLTPSK